MLGIVADRYCKPVDCGTRNFLYAAVGAAFIKESGMKPAGAASRTGNPEKGRSLMLLSVVVPARNEADVLRPCLDLCSQADEGFVWERTGNCGWWMMARPTGPAPSRSAKRGRTGARSCAPAARLDRKSQCNLDRCPKGARRMAPVYGCGYHSPARRPGASYSRSGTCACRDALLLSKAASDRILAAGPYAVGLCRARRRLSSAKSFRAESRVALPMVSS